MLLSGLVLNLDLTDSPVLRYTWNADSLMTNLQEEVALGGCRAEPQTLVSG